MSEKFQRTIKLDCAVNEQLITLCSAIGVNVNSYLLNEIGKAVRRDSIALQLQRSSEKMIGDFMARIADSLVEQKSAEE